jgi:hypothetical protein
MEVIRVSYFDFGAPCARYEDLVLLSQIQIIIGGCGLAVGAAVTVTLV